jgi:hypothetical protein
MVSAQPRHNQLPLLESTTFVVETHGDAELVTWSGSTRGQGILATVGRAAQARLETADMVIVPDPAMAHRTLADLPGCAVVAAERSPGCVVRWRGGSVVIMADPVVAAAFVYSRIAVGGSLPAHGSWAVGVTWSGTARRLVLRTG